MWRKEGQWKEHGPWLKHLVSSLGLYHWCWYRTVSELPIHKVG